MLLLIKCTKKDLVLLKKDVTFYLAIYYSLVFTPNKGFVPFYEYSTLINSEFRVISTVASLHRLMKTVLKDFPLAVTYLSGLSSLGVPGCPGTPRFWQIS